MAETVSILAGLLMVPILTLAVIALVISAVFIGFGLMSAKPKPVFCNSLYICVPRLDNKLADLILCFTALDKFHIFD